MCLWRSVVHTGRGTGNAAGMSSEDTRAASVKTRTGSSQSARNWSAPATSKISSLKAELSAANIRMVCRDNPNKPASGEEVQKGCFGAAGLDREVGEGALQPLDKMKFVEHGGKALLII